MKLGALEKLATATDVATKMFVINPDTGLTLKCPAGKECYIEFLPIDSKPGQDINRSRSAAQLAKLRSGRNRQTEEDDELVKMQVETCAALAVGWYFGDEAEAFSAESARALFANPEYAWLRRDSWVYIHDTANFIKRSSNA